MTHLFNNAIKYDDSPNIDAFGGLRSTNARILGEYRFHYDQGQVMFMNDLVQAGASLTPDFGNCQYIATVTTTANSRVVLQSKQYHPYISGTSNKALVTFKMGQGKANVRQMAGLYDDNNGIFFRMNGTIPEMVVRKKGVDTEVVPSTAWNIDRLDGLRDKFNPSGITADFTKCHIFTADYQWLGVGRVRVGFVIDGTVHIVHEFNHANATTEPYMMQPSLPIRWEIVNTGTASSSTSMQFICGAVYCEGSDNEVGFTKTISTESNVTSVTSTTDGDCLLAIKLKDLVNGKPNQTFARIKEWSVTGTNDIGYKIVIAANANTLFTGTPVWQTVPGYSACEYVKNPAIRSGWQANAFFTVVANGFASGATGSGSGVITTTDSFTLSDAIYQNYFSNSSQVLAIICTKFVNNADCKGTLRWIEVK